MKQVLLMIALVALVGCEESLDERIVGAYREIPEEGADWDGRLPATWLVFEPNGDCYWYDNEHRKQIRFGHAKFSSSTTDKGEPDFRYWVRDKVVHISLNTEGLQHESRWTCRLVYSEWSKDDELMIDPNNGEQFRRIAVHHAHPLYEKLKKTSNTSDWFVRLLAFVFVVVGFGPRLWSFLFD